MPCNCGRGNSVAHRVIRPDGTIKRYATEQEAKAAAEASGGTYRPVSR
jgi:hypothetical protein